MPKEIVTVLKNAKIKRFMCQINNGLSFHTSLIPAGEGIYFIKVNKSLRDQHELILDRQINISLEEDDSKYGIPLPPEMSNLLSIDPEGDSYFHRLTPGKQRSLLYLIGNVKNSHKRLEKSFIILEHLKEQNGSLDFKILHQDFKHKKGII